MIQHEHLPRCRRLTTLLRGFVVRREGTSGVEFALVLPILLALLAGTADLGHALTVSRKMDEITATTGDMISQQGTWTKLDVDKLLAGASFIVQPYSVSALKITVAVEDIVPGGAAVVNWSAGFNTPPLAAGSKSTVSVPANIQQAGVQVVLTRAQYTLTTPVSAFFAYFTGSSGYSFDRYFFNRPRASDTITYN
ncbi:TadE/TadG family type IV pilus assembly protein [Rhizobium sp. Leaf341]|uniref:TadE/TadG family type IV pilus assembly protein n=1 Tax=Rhizobium sp. Leaf341 TaxID=1736344 RepID=UPI0009E79035|nr:TadE/TadG family type IV pilus assembly protein [Rhizobium sp. Leaf341]